MRWRFGDQLRWEPRMAVLRWSADDELAPTVHACRAVVAVRLGWPEREEAFLRVLSMLVMAGEPADYSDTFELAAARAGLPVADLAAFAGRDDVQAALEADAALASGRPCPSYEVEGVEVASLEDLEAALGGLVPRDDPSSASEVLAWAPYPLSTAEVAAVCDRDAEAVRAELARSARFERLGADGHWSPA